MPPVGPDIQTFKLFNPCLLDAPFCEKPFLELLNRLQIEITCLCGYVFTVSQVSQTSLDRARGDVAPCFKTAIVYNGSDSRNDLFHLLMSVPFVRE